MDRSIDVVRASNCGIRKKHSGEEMIEGEMGKKIDDKLSPLIQKSVTSHDLSGLALGIVRDNEIVYARGFGFKNIEARDPITTTTIFHMASISKTFVATAIMQLAEERKIDLDAPVITYLPYFKLDGEQYKEITIEQMLSHVSGIPNVKDYEWDTPQYDAGALERYVRSLASEKMLHAPGEKFAYSNMAFECLGDVIAKVSGISFADYEKKYVLNEAGMHESTFLKPEHLPENWAAPHFRTIKTVVWEGYPYNRMHGPSSTLHSNVLEMCNWAIINMNHGAFNGKKILDSSSYDLLWKPLAKFPTPIMAPLYQSVGLSWLLGEWRGEKTVGHPGADVGFSANLVVLPEKSMAVVVFGNWYPPQPIIRFTEVILDIILGYEPEVFSPPASIRVCRTLDEKGLTAAVEQWNLLKQDHPHEYDFSGQQFLLIESTAMELDRTNDAENIAHLCAEIMPNSFMETIEETAESHLKDDPDNKAAAAILEVIRKKDNGQLGSRSKTSSLPHKQEA